jgi:hypothetical protein
MKRLLLCLAVSAASASAFAWPTITASPYAAGTAPERVHIMVEENRQAIPCELVQVQAGLQPTCDLKMLGPGKWTLYMHADTSPVCEPTADGAICRQGGAAVSAPFVLTLTTSGAPPAALAVGR